MNLKGDYSGLTSYSVGDAVRWTDGSDVTMYVLRKPASSGTPPTDSLYWERLPQELQAAADMILDFGLAVENKIPSLANNLTTTASGKALDARQGKALKTLIDDLGTAVGGLDADLEKLYPSSKSIVLDSSTASSTKKFAITVDDDGELTATEIVEAGET